MKVLVVTHFFPPGYAGGTEAYTLGLARELRRQGHGVWVLCAENWGQGKSWVPTYRDDVYDGIPVRRLSFNWQLAPNPFVGLYDNPHTAQCFIAYAREIQPDVVHVTSCYSLGARILDASKTVGVPALLTLTDYWFLCPRITLLKADGEICTGQVTAFECQRCLALGGAPLRLLERVLPHKYAVNVLLELGRRRAFIGSRRFRGHMGDAQRRRQFLARSFAIVAQAIAPSNFLKQVYVINGYPSDRILYSKHGIDLSWTRRIPRKRPGRSIRFGYIGQFERIKGVHVMVQAVRVLAESLPIEVIVYGDPQKSPDYWSPVSGLADGDSRIRFAGGFERAQVPDVYSDLDAVVIPSLWYENAPAVISEAFAAGVPVIGTRLGGIAELVQEGVNGLLFERGDARGLAEAICRFASDPVLRERLRQGIPPVRSIEDEVGALVQIYRKTLDRRPVDAPMETSG